jgi:triacylglycerol lipase
MRTAWCATTRTVRRATTRTVTAALIAVAATTLHPVAALATDEPELQVDRAELRAAMDCPEAFTDEGRNPVLLVHGTGPTPRENFGWNLLPQLRADGFDVCTVELPTRALGDIQVAAEYVVHGVREVHERSGQQVDVAGHSQGGLEPRWALAWWPSTRDLVGDLVTFASPHHGTVVTDVACAASRCWPAVHQMRPGSAFLEALHAQEDLTAVEVTSLGSVHDELVQPPTTIELDGASNIILQDVCPARPVTHISIVADALAYELLLDAYEHAGPADPSRLRDDICTATTIEEAGPHDLLTVESLLGYADPSQLDPEIPRSLLTDEEPELAPYAAAEQDGGEDGGTAEEPDGAEEPDRDDTGGSGDPEDAATAGTDGAGTDAPSVRDGDLAVVGASTATLPATGSTATTLALALLAAATLARPRSLPTGREGR